MNGQTTTYVLDLQASLTQVLFDGERTYLYGHTRLAQLGMGTPDTHYFLGDVLSAVRQLTDMNGAVTYAAAYAPYGEVLARAGETATPYGFTGEGTDPTGLVYLRARYYSPQVGRFFQQDPWNGEPSTPSTLNPYQYGLNNPVLYTDPSGKSPLAPLVAFALVVGIGAGGGAIYGCLSYEWALTGQCGCELQQQALSMTKADWVGMHALVAGIAAGVISLSAVTPATSVLVGGVLAYYAITDFVNVLQVVYNEGVGWTTCNVVRAVLDIAVGIFGGSSVVRGVRAWRASGSWLQWPTEAPAALRQFFGIRGKTAEWIKSRIPADWRQSSGYYPAGGERIPQYKFTSPDGNFELRIHRPHPGRADWVARIGMRVPAGTPLALENRPQPGEYWLYFSNDLLATGDLDLMHIPVCISL